MRIFVKVKTGARETQITEIEPGQFAVFVKEAPEKGRANRAVIKALAKYLRLAPANLKIISGTTANRKVVKIS